MARATGRLGELLRVDDTEEQIILPRMRSWLTDHTSIKADIPTIVSILEDDSNNQRSGRFGASSRGTCHRRQVFAYEGMPVTELYDPRLSLVFMDGTWRHIKWQMLGLEAKVFTHVEVPYAVPELKLKVSLDALNEDEGWFFELKGAYKIPDEPDKYLLQIHTCFLATDFDRCSLLVEEKGSQKLKEWVITPNKKIMKEVTNELEALNHAVDERDLPAILTSCEKRSGEYTSCPYRGDCLSQHSCPVDGTWGDG